MITHSLPSHCVLDKQRNHSRNSVCFFQPQGVPCKPELSEAGGRSTGEKQGVSRHKPVTGGPPLVSTPRGQHFTHAVLKFSLQQKELYLSHTSLDVSFPYLRTGESRGPPALCEARPLALSIAAAPPTSRTLKFLHVDVPPRQSKCTT